MQNAETVLGVLRERGRRGLPVNELYRQLFNRELYLLAYGRIYSNKGAMTPGVNAETVDGMSMTKIDTVIESMRHERYRFSPARRVHIPKRDGKTRPLGLPTWPDKLVGEVVRLLLEAYYEPTFSDRSHGFRSGRGCHTALAEISNTWKGTTWFVEGDIADCFGSFDHQVMLSILSEKIHDNRFLQLLRNMLTAGYLEDWEWNVTYSGTPQGGVASPILSNIYLDRLDKFVETVLIPRFTKGGRRAGNPAYEQVQNALAQAQRRDDRATARELRKRLRKLPSKDLNDPGYRRLRYVRYCDDILLGFAGPKVEAEEIKAQLAAFLRDDLALDMSHSKTLVTHARTGAAKFLGYEIAVGHSDTKLTGGRRSINGAIVLHVPATVIKAKCAPHMRHGKPIHRSEMANETDYAIVATFGAEYRGIVGYYQLANDVYRLTRLRWIMERSLLKTLAMKYQSTVTKMARKYRTSTPTPHGPRRCFEAVLQRGEDKRPWTARFGGIPLKRQRKAVLDDHKPIQPTYPRKELIRRFSKGRCEICEQADDVRVHHVRKLADLATTGQPQPAWAQLMTKMRRKSLVVCRTCHDNIHHRHPATLTR